MSEVTTDQFPSSIAIKIDTKSLPQLIGPSCFLNLSTEKTTDVTICKLEMWYLALMTKAVVVFTRESSYLQDIQFSSIVTSSVNVRAPLQMTNWFVGMISMINTHNIPTVVSTVVSRYLVVLLEVSWCHLVASFSPANVGTAGARYPEKDMKTTL